MLASSLAILAQIQTTRTTTTDDGGGMIAMLGMACYVLFLLTITIIIVAANWKIFTKAGQPGWAAIVPIYNMIVHLQIIGQPLWLIALVFIPCVNLIGIFIVGWLMADGTAKAFGKGTGFAVGLFLLPIVFYPILGFGSAQYIGPPNGGGGSAPAPRPGVRR